MIELAKLTKSYLSKGTRRYVFRDLSFVFPHGVNIALIGRNGAGKSTLMRLLGGIDTPDSGRVVTDKSISWPVGLQGGFQGTLSGRDNVKFVCRIFGAGGADMAERVRFVEEFAEIGEYFDQPVKSYSSGMRSRLAFGLSMAFDFDYYLIDEVMAVGDAQFKRKSKAILAERLQTSNLILVTHNMSEVDKFCDVVVLLEGGRATLYEDVRAGIRAYQGEGGETVLHVPQPTGEAGERHGDRPRGVSAPQKGTPRPMVPKAAGLRGPQTPRPAAGAAGRGKGPDALRGKDNQTRGPQGPQVPQADGRPTAQSGSPANEHRPKGQSGPQATGTRPQGGSAERASTAPTSNDQAPKPPAPHARGAAQQPLRGPDDQPPRSEGSSAARATRRPGPGRSGLQPEKPPGKKAQTSTVQRPLAGRGGRRPEGDPNQEVDAGPPKSAPEEPKATGGAAAPDQAVASEAALRRAAEPPSRPASTSPSA